MTRRRFSLALCAVILAVLAVAVWFTRAAYGDRSLPHRATTVIVPSGATGHDIAQLLAKDDIIASPLVFELLAKAHGEQSAMKAGEFRFEAHRSADDVLHQIVSGGEQVAVWVTFPEGLTAKEMAAVLASHDLGAEDGFDNAFLHGSIVIDGERTHSLEGFLFPDTYLIPTEATPQTVADILTAQFRRELPPDAAARARHLGLTVPQVVTLASLVEREAKADDERALMAGVYYNRLRLGMPLEVDATIEYTFAHHKDVITEADLARDSPYNTYKHTGLPPTPIANPGEPSLHAAFFPEHSDYLYYVYKGNGHHAFSRTLAEHNANVARYLR